MFTNRMMNDFAPLWRLHDEMDRMFERFFDEVPAARSYAATYPAFNVWESDDGNAAYLEAELPGMKIEDLDITVLGNQLTIAGQRQIGNDDPKSNVNWLRRERASGRFTRTLTLPWDIDPDKVEARFVNGVLTVTLPKSEASKPKKVKLLS